MKVALALAALLATANTAMAIPPPAVDIHPEIHLRPVEPGEGGEPGDTQCTAGSASAYARQSDSPYAWARAKLGWTKCSLPPSNFVVEPLTGSDPALAADAATEYQAVTYEHGGGVGVSWGHDVRKDNSGCTNCQSPPYARTETWIAGCYPCTTMVSIGALADARAA